MAQLMPRGHVWVLVKGARRSDAFLSRQVPWRTGGSRQAEEERTHVVAFRDIAHAFTFCSLAKDNLGLWHNDAPPVSLRNASQLAERLVLNGMALDVVEGLTGAGDLQITTYFADDLPTAVYAANLDHLLSVG